MFLAVALLLPFLTAQVQPLGNAICPMHLPVLLCGFFCGPIYGVIVGLFSPILRFALFGAPALMPIGIAMCFELATYGLVSGLLYQSLPKKKSSIYISLIGAMLIGRIIWGLVMAIISGAGESSFGWAAFLSGAFLNAIPGIILQIILIPILVMTIKKVNR